MAKILDACCGGRMFWFDKAHPDAVYMDNRRLDTSNGQHFVVSPDILGDFREMPFEDNTFSLVVFDPPHLKYAGKTSWLREKYGCLDKETWREDLSKGFRECFKVLKPDGVLIFKWNEKDIKTSEIIKLSPVPPLFGHPSGKASRTQWMVFMKLSIITTTSESDMLDESNG